MSGLITTRSARLARRRAVVFAVLLALSLAGMAVSATAPVRELQSGVGFAFRPIQAAVAGVAGTIGSVIESIQEMQTLRQDNRDLRAELERLRIDQRPAPGVPGRERPAAGPPRRQERLGLPHDRRDGHRPRASRSSVGS